MLHLYNTLTRKKEAFRPIHGTDVGLYTCGPTVYNYAHIGNLRTYVFEDILRRVLKHDGFSVQHVMNITDVGHLTDDADMGEDKMEKGARREGKSAWDIAKFYTEAFEEDIASLNILEPNIWCKATDHIPEQIALVETLIDKGYTYETGDGIYFDTTKLDDYGKLAGLKNQTLEAGARVDMGEKKNPHDFALWKWSERSELHPEQSGRVVTERSELHPEQSKPIRHPELVACPQATAREGSPASAKRQMEWDAFGHKGFPGWHIECSAMAMKYLGDHFDIHCGGVDHIPVHHTNEIAQSESATGKKPWVNYWLHGEFLLIDHETSSGQAQKMAKSGENFITLNTLKERGYSPLAYRYFLLQAHYRKQLSFSFEALDAAEQGLKRLRQKVQAIDPHAVGDPKIAHEFDAALNDDLNIPEALGVLWNGLKENAVTLDMVTAFDKVLGLDLRKHEDVLVPPEVQKLLDERQIARDNKDWDASDRLRGEILALGFRVEDTDEGQRVN